MAIEIIGPLATLAGLSMSFAHFMQAAKLLKTKSAKDLSLPMYLIFFFGSIVWLAYGYSINEFPVIISFGISVAGTALVLFLALKFRKKTA